MCDTTGVGCDDTTTTLVDWITSEFSFISKKENLRIVVEQLEQLGQLEDKLVVGEVDNKEEEHLLKKYKLLKQYNS